MAAAIITVTGTFYKPDGVTPSKGTVTFQLAVELQDQVLNRTYPVSPKVIALDGSGHFSVPLVASNDPALTPTGGTYWISEYVDGLSNTYQAVVPYNAAGGTVDRADLVPSSPQLTYGVSRAEFDAAVALSLIPHVQTYPEGNIQTFFGYTPDNSQDGITRGIFQLTAGGALFNSTWDNVLMLGYNMNSGGSQLVANEAAGGWFFETDYEFPALTHLMEMYWQLRTNDNSVNVRPVFMQFDRSTGTTTVQLQGYGATGHVTTLIGATQVEDATNGTTFMRNGQLVTFDKSGGGARKMIQFLNVAGTNYWDALQLLATGLCLGNAGAIRVAENSVNCGFFGTNPVAKPTVSGAKGGNPALGSLMTALSGMGLVTDSTSA